MQKVLSLLRENNAPQSDLLFGQIQQNLKYFNGQLLSHDSIKIEEAVAKLLPFVDFSQDKYLEDFMFIPKICLFQYEPEVVAEMTLTGMLKCLFRNKVITSCKGNVIYKGDSFEMDIVEHTFNHVAGIKQDELEGAFVQMVFANGERSLTFMDAKEINASYSLACHKKYGNNFPHENVSTFYLQCLVRRCLNNNIALIMDIGEDKEILVRQMIALHNFYYIEFDRIDNEMAERKNSSLKSRFISNEPSKTMMIMQALNQQPRTNNVVKLSLVESDNSSITQQIADAW